MKTVLTHLLLFLLFLKIGVVSFGGAYSIWSLVEQDFVKSGSELGSVTLEPMPEAQLHDFIKIGQMIPGPVVSTVMLVGNRYSGLVGMFAVFFALLVPSALAMMGLFHVNKRVGDKQGFVWFKQGALGSVVGILAFFVWHLMEKTPQTGLFQMVLFWVFAAFLFVLIHVKRANVILVTLYSGLIAWMVHWGWMWF